MEAGLTAVDGTKYAVTFTDEASKQIITICLKKKSEFGGVMTEFLARLHTLPELMVLDTGGENVSKQFLQVCYRFCIQPRYTTPSPEQHEENLAERSIQTLRDSMITMLASAAMSPIYWPFALLYATYINQFIPGDNGKCPYLCWHSELPPDLTLPLFGSPMVYRQEHPHKQEQLDLPGHSAKFLGIDSYGYGAWILDTSEQTRPNQTIKRVCTTTFSRGGCSRM